MKVMDYVLGLLQKKSTIDDSVDLDTFDYMENGYVDSLGVIQFVFDMEEEFGIAFTDEELASSSFRIVGELVKLIEKKLEEKE
ncbi:hypothetical protein J19TS2_18580 [Cohnella xylanilytica]|uniref:acyl carrier protein n=1 Tax=Cohnella xylanilytica TaxID=557555 RepID=UPI001B13C17C|nr:acyl carrier protein [Cohnella xylanilytica]GIO12303.1 hypothetical protein J19TS2_18580 [Cohnella xylanilytica]